MNEENRRIGQRLKDFRKLNGISIVQAAEHINVSPAFISMVENGRSGISFNRTHQLVQLYGKTLSDLTNAEEADAVIINMNAAPVVANEPGVTIYGLTKQDNGMHLGGFRLSFEPGAEHEFDQHSGYEYALIIEGDFHLHLHNVYREAVECRTLHSGDTTIYPSTLMHRWKNISNDFGTLFIIEAKQ